MLVAILLGIPYNLMPMPLIWTLISSIMSSKEGYGSGLPLHGNYVQRKLILSGIARKRSESEISVQI
jgi:hypothetical protein